MPSCWLCSDRPEGCYTPDQCAPFVTRWTKPVPPEPDVVSEPPGGQTPYDLDARGEGPVFIVPDEPVVPDPAGRDHEPK